MLTYSAQPNHRRGAGRDSELVWNPLSGKGPSLDFLRKASRVNPPYSYFSSFQDTKFEMVERCLLFQVKQKRLTLNLENFLIRTAYQGEKLCLNIDRDPALEHRFLASTLRQFTNQSIRRSTRGFSGQSKAWKTTSRTHRLMRLPPLQRTI